MTFHDLEQKCEQRDTVNAMRLGTRIGRLERKAVQLAPPEMVLTPEARESVMRLLDRYHSKPDRYADEIALLEGITPSAPATANN